ncbi:Synapse-associated protein 1 [Haplosporangium bisporale]|nr:Synapse-associated protein 1 [Haplosporangium bisporale]
METATEPATHPVQDLKNTEQASLPDDTSNAEPSTTTSTTAPPSSAGAFAAAMLPSGFAAPKINTSFFSSGLGKIQSTLANAKSPTLNIQPPQLNINQIQASTEQLASTTKDWGFSAFKTLSSAAQRVSNNVTQGIQKEHEEFLKQKKMDNVIPHQGTGTDFIFDMKVYSSTALATLKQDPNLNKMRFYLVPKEVEELVFWRNYFYRVSLLKQVSLASAASDSLEGSSGTTGLGLSGAFPEGVVEDGNTTHRRSSSLTATLGYNIYFGTDDVGTSSGPTTSRKGSGSVKESVASKDAKVVKKTEKPEVIFEAEMPDHDEDPDAWLEKQLASSVSIGDDDDGDVDVADWEKELQNELKDYVEGA